MTPTLTRTPLHKRAVTYRGFSRSDGLWDIEARLVDTKDAPLELFGGGFLPAGSPAHDMFICVTLDDALKIVDIRTDMHATPFGECADAREPMRRLIGATLGPGWRRTIDAAIGGERGCTHLRELLFNLATAAFQTVGPALRDKRERSGEPPNEANSSYFIGQCMSWRRDGPPVQRYFPMFYVAKPDSTTI